DLFGVVFFCVMVLVVTFYLLKAQKAKEETEKSPFRAVEYHNVNDANLGIAAMDKEGWTVKSMDTTDGHINVGRTATYTILTGGLALFLGGSRTRGKVTVMYERKPKPTRAPRKTQTAKATISSPPKRTRKATATTAATVKRTRTRKPAEVPAV